MFKQYFINWGLNIIIIFFWTNTETFEIFATIVTFVALDWEIQI